MSVFAKLKEGCVIALTASVVFEVTASVAGGGGDSGAGGGEGEATSSGEGAASSNGLDEVVIGAMGSSTASTDELTMG